MAMTVSPTFSEEGDYLGSEIESRSEGLWKEDQGYIETEQGFTHAFKDVELDEGFGEPDSSYADTIIESFGGIEAYQEMTQWAAETQSPDFIEWFNEAMDGDPDEMHQALDYLQALFNEFLEAAEDEGYPEEDDEEESPELQEFVSDVYEEYPDVQDAIAWAASALSEEAVETFNDIIDGGNPSEMAKAIITLMNLYYANNETDDDDQEEPYYY